MSATNTRGPPAKTHVKGSGKKPHASRNYEIAPGINRYSRSAMYRRSGKAAMKVAGKQFKKIAPKAQPKQRSARYYNADVQTTKKPRSDKSRPATLRKTITPGTVLILLAGRFRGKRVIFLRQLPSGLLLVTGPFKVNGVPLRRVNQSYVIATSTRVDISGIDSSTFTDDQFHQSEKEKAATSGKTGFFDQAGSSENKDKPQSEGLSKKKESQKNFDKQLLAVVSQTPRLEAYLSARFSLTRGQYPHEMRF